MTANIKTFPDPNAAAAGLAKDLAQLVQETLAGQEKIAVALSGGNTAKILFEHLASEYADKIDWNRIHFFWGDERCVAPDDSDSNYGAARELLLDKIQIDDANIHRVRGEDDPDEERSRYENDIYEFVEIDDNAIPVFDLIILGMGEDGHTASIFPHQMQFIDSDRVCEVAIHPETAQKRITLSGPVLNAAAKVAFLITGESKAAVLGQVIQKTGDFQQYPAAHVDAADRTFYVDEAAGQSC
jgi:6-phosphogluconolactonase